MAKVNQMNFDEGLSETVVGQSVKIEGDLVSDGDIKIEGVVTGSVKTSKSLYVGPAASIEADVEAASVTVAGTLEGNSKVRDLMVILQTGRVTGDIDCRHLAVEEGAYFSGECKMSVDKTAEKQKRQLPEED